MNTAAGTPVTVRWGDRAATVSTDPHPARLEGRHAWTAALMFDIADPGRAGLLVDHENLRSVTVFCWWCRATTGDGTPCPGRPD